LRNSRLNYDSLPLLRVEVGLYREPFTDTVEGFFIALKLRSYQEVLKKCVTGPSAWPSPWWWP